jgi:hypothetical protein
LNLRLPPLLVLSALALPATGCDALKDFLTEVDGDLETRTFSVDSSDGIATIEVDVDSQESFLLTATSGSLLAVESVHDPEGNRVLYWEDWYGTESLTGAVWLEGQSSVLNWPIRQADGSLSQGTWTVEVGVVDTQGYYTDDTVNADLRLKTDGDLSAGTVSVRIIYADGLDSDEEVTNGVTRAVERWIEVWAPFGLQLEVEYLSSNFSTNQPSPGEGNEHGEVAAGSDGQQVSILVSETINGSADYYGIAGGIPGTLGRTDSALIIVSWLANAGGDGAFSEADVRLFGETLAHETGHYMGLFHPVEMTYDYWDALSDTEACTGQNACESALQDNLMFPYPVCDWTECVAQDQMSDQQVGVKHRYTGTL